MGHSTIRYDGYYILQTTHIIPSNEESKTRENVKVMTSQAQPRRRRAAG